MKTVTAPTRELPPAHRLFFDGGVALAELTLSLPDLTDLPPRITSYYADLCDALTDFCESVLFPACKAAYTGDSDPRKRFTYRRAVLTLRCDYTRTGDLFSVRRCLTLRQGGTSRTLLHAEVFRLSDGRILPLSAWLRENGAPAIPAAPGEGGSARPRLSLPHRLRRAEYYLSGTCPVLLSRGEEVPLASLLSCKKRKNGL